MLITFDIKQKYFSHVPVHDHITATTLPENKK